MEMRAVGQQFALPPVVWATGLRTESHYDAFGRGKAPVRWMFEASTIMAMEEALREIEQRYFLSMPENVQRFIRRNPLLAPLLLEASEQLNRLFGPAPYVSLRVVVDPEVENLDKLFACIRVSSSVEDARRQLRRLDREWFLDQLDRAAGKFNFVLEFA